MSAYQLPTASLYSDEDHKISRLTSLYLVNVRKPASLSEIHHFLRTNQCRQSLSEIHLVLQKYSKHFEIYQDGILYVKLITKVGVCETHCRRNETCSGNIPVCSGLHICKYFLLTGKCTFGRQCIFGHDLTTSHNMNVLKENLLNGATVDDLKSYFSQAGNRSEFTKPRVCKFYQTKQGCKMSNGGRVCTNLHICRHYLQQRCKFGTKCSRSHDILNIVVKSILEKHGILTNRKPKEILEDLRKVLANDISDNSSCGSEPSASGIEQLNIGRNFDRQTSVKGRESTVHRDHKERNDTESICFYFLRDRCLYGDDCRNFHSKLLYQWRYRAHGDANWLMVSPQENQDMELSYSDPKNKEYFFDTGNGTTCKVQFKTTVVMSGVDDADTNYEIQRLSTASSVAFERQSLTTLWNWFWKNQKGKWMQYGEIDGAYKSDITSTEIEQAYLQNPEGQMAFCTLGHEYILDFPSMFQRNLHYKTKREVCRRPVFVSKSETVEKKKRKPRQLDGASAPDREGESKLAENEKAPSHWSRTESLLDHCKIVEIQKKNPSTKKEYEVIEKLFCESMPSTASIASIERIENGELYSDYVSKKKKMEKKKKDIGERRLFHGTKESYVDAICKQGFDFRLNGQSVGTLYGKGSYFATTSKYSHSYTDGRGICSMFVVKVLAGEYALGKKKYVRPPPKDESNLCSDLYDSCVNDISDPKIFVIFDNSGQVYPEYLIKYEYKF